jgi:hypothetical protein
VTTQTQPQVGSPLHAALARLYAQIQGDQQSMAGALKNACQQMGGGSNTNGPWFGPTASSWNTDLTGYSSNLNSSIAAAVTAVQQALASTPATCPPGQAKMETMFLEGY